MIWKSYIAETDNIGMFKHCVDPMPRSDTDSQPR
jgi:hypothetical protein